MEKEIEGMGRFASADAIKARMPTVSHGLVTSVPKRTLEALQQVPHPKSSILDAAIPLPTNIGVYFLIRDGDVVYVGQSVNVLDRISKHRREGKVFDSFAFMECQASHLDRYEQMYIEAFVPELNKSLGNASNVRQPSKPKGAKERQTQAIASFSGFC